MRKRRVRDESDDMKNMQSRPQKRAKTTTEKVYPYYLDALILTLKYIRIISKYLNFPVYFIVRRKNLDKYHRKLTCKHICTTQNFLVNVMEVSHCDLQLMKTCKPCAECCLPTDPPYKRKTKQSLRKYLPYYQATYLFQRRIQPGIKMLKNLIAWNTNLVFEYIRAKIHEASEIIHDGHIVSKLAKGCGGLTIFGIRRNISIWNYIYQTGDYSVLNRSNVLQFLSSCNVKNCFTHHYPVRFDITLEELNEYEYQYQCERFQKFIKKSTKLKFNNTYCMEWTGCLNAEGYGQFNPIYTQTPRNAHIVSWELASCRRVSNNMQIMHKCNNRSCVNEYHLCAGTAKENYVDKVTAGTNLQGERHPNSFLTAEIAMQIIKSINTGKSTTERAKKFGITTSHLAAFDCGETWKHLLDEDDLKNRRKRRKINPITNELKELIRCEMKQGKPLSYIAISRKYKINRKTVKKIIHTKTQTQEDTKNDYYEHIKKVIKLKIQIKDGHWFARTPLNAQGYAQIGFNKKTVGMHIVSWIVHNNKSDVPNNMVIRHKCKFRSCVNPDHLEIGTHKQNAEDRKRDGTNLQGEDNPRSTVTEFIVKQIIASKNHPWFHNISRSQVGKFFGVSKSQMSHIDHRESWKHIDPNKCQIHWSVLIHMYFHSSKKAFKNIYKKFTKYG